MTVSTFRSECTTVTMQMQETRRPENVGKTLFVHVRGRKNLNIFILDPHDTCWIMLTHLPQPSHCSPRDDKARSGRPSRKRTSSTAARSRASSKAFCRNSDQLNLGDPRRWDSGTRPKPSGQPGPVEKCILCTYLRHAVVIQRLNYAKLSWLGLICKVFSWTWHCCTFKSMDSQQQTQAGFLNKKTKFEGNIKATIPLEPLEPSSFW